MRLAEQSPAAMEWESGQMLLTHCQKDTVNQITSELGPSDFYHSTDIF
jgi:hypothetical protein